MQLDLFGQSEFEPKLYGKLLVCWYDPRKDDFNQKLDEAKKAFPDHGFNSICLPIGSKIGRLVIKDLNESTKG